MGADEDEAKRFEEQKQKAESARQALIEDGKKLVAQMGIKVTNEMPKPSKPGTSAVNSIKLQTNLFGIKMNEEHTIYKFDVDIHCDLGKKIVEFTKKGKTDYIVSDRKRKCVAVFGKAVKQLPCYRDDLVFFYDGQAMAFTTQPLAWSNPSQPHETLIMEGSTFGSEFEPFPMITFRIKPCAESPYFQLSDLRKCDHDSTSNDRTAMQFADVVTSMHCLDGADRFTVFAHGKIFPNRPDLENIKTQQMEEGKVLIPGLTKAVKLIEGPRGRDNTSPAIAMESLKVCFHEKMCLIEKAKLVWNRSFENPSSHELEVFAGQVRGLGCTTNHQAKPRRLEIHGISKDNAKKKIEVKLENGGMSRVVTVEEYFNMKYNRVLKYPNAPLAMSRERGQINLYPMECLDVIPMQRVTIPQTTGTQSQVMTKACAVGPAERQNEIMDQCRIHDLFNPNHPYMKAAGLGIVQRPLQVEARVLPAPALQFGATTITVEPIPGNWRTPPRMTYAMKGSCTGWAMYAILGPRDNFSRDNLIQFGRAFWDRCKERGIQMGEPYECLILDNPPSEKGHDYWAREKLKEAHNKGLSFVLFVVNDFIAVHKYLKLEERYAQVATQCLKLKTVQTFMAKNQNLTLDNIVHKTNMKMGGLNYNVTMEPIFKNPAHNPFPESRLIMGLGLSHCPSSAVFSQKLAPPSSVGWSANCARFPTEYIGDFMLQDGGKTDLMATLKPIMQCVLDRFMGKVDEKGEANQPQKKAGPKELIIYRQGVADGQFADIMTDEIPLVKAVLASNGCGDCKVTYIIVQKDHNIRLFHTDIKLHEKAPQQNVGVGIVVDSQITHPNYREFFLNTHLTLQGSARTPRYIILYDDGNISMNQLEITTSALAFNFQIVGSPISLPAPLYIANRYAERGTMLHNARITDELATTDQKKRNNLEYWNEDLPYSKTVLGSKRINA